MLKAKEFHPLQKNGCNNLSIKYGKKASSYCTESWQAMPLRLPQRQQSKK